MTAANIEPFYADKRVPYCSLDVQKSFEQLSTKEKLYAHFISRASWAGARIVQKQWTPYASDLYDLLILTFSKSGKLCNLEELKQKSGVKDDDWNALLQYSAQVWKHRFQCFMPVPQMQWFIRSSAILSITDLLASQRYYLVSPKTSSRKS